MFRRMTRERFLSDAELAAFIAAVRERHHKNQPRDHALFALLANTGIRPSEALALTRADVHVGGREPWIQLKRGHRRHWPEPTNELAINPKVAAVVKTYTDRLALGDRLFPYTKRQMARVFHYYSGKAGLSPHYRIYALRHTVGMRLWRHTRDLRLMQAIMGHSRLKATMAYVHVGPELIRQACEAVGPVG